MFMIKFFESKYGTFKENDLVIEIALSNDIKEDPDELLFGYLREEKFDILSNKSIFHEHDTAFVTRPSNKIEKKQTAKIVDEVVRQIATKENKIIDVGKIFDDGYKQIEETGSYICKLPSLKRKENEPVIFKITDGFFVFVQPENLSISTSPDIGGVMELSIYRGQNNGNYPYNLFASIDVDEKDSKLLNNVIKRVAKAIVDKEKIINIPKIIEEEKKISQEGEVEDIINAAKTVI